MRPLFLVFIMFTTWSAHAAVSNKTCLHRHPVNAYYSTGSLSLFVPKGYQWVFRDLAREGPGKVKLSRCQGSFAEIEIAEIPIKKIPKSLSDSLLLHTILEERSKRDRKKNELFTDSLWQAGLRDVRTILPYRIDAVAVKQGKTFYRFYVVVLLKNDDLRVPVVATLTLHWLLPSDIGYFLDTIKTFCAGECF